jgi:hypothetical protein
MRDGNLETKTTLLLLTLLLSIPLLPNYLVADEALCESNVSTEAEEQLEPITTVEIMKITKPFPRRKVPDSNGITNVVLKQLPVVL